MPALCRDCLTRFSGGPRCPACRSPRLVAHAELESLTIAHMDCDAFYASVEKRDNPVLAFLSEHFRFDLNDHNQSSATASCFSATTGPRWLCTKPGDTTTEL